MIAFDIDDTAFDTFPLFRAYFEHLLNIKIEVPEVWKNFLSPHVPDSEFNKYLTDASNAINPYMRMSIKDLDAMLWFYKWTDFLSPIFISARQKSIADITRKRLAEVIPIPHSVIFTGSHSKLEAIKANEIKYFFEDRYFTVCEVAPICKLVFMIRKNWNYKRPLPNNVIPVNNIAEGLHYLKRNLNGYHE